MGRRIAFYEWLAGKLLVRAARLRAARLGPNDAHELRHLYAAIVAGNTDPCMDWCHLDVAAVDLFASSGEPTP